MNETKRQDLPGDLAAASGRELKPNAYKGLHIVATPIGNLGDLSERARKVLEGVDAVLCEDTRRTSRLMAALGLRTRMERYDAHASESAIARFVERLRAGETLAVVTDAGTPGISDPAAALVKAAREAGVAVTPVPGASAPVALLSVAGFEATSFVFRGFFPRKAGDRSAQLELAKSSGALARVFVWFESPERIVDALSAVSEVSPDARVIAGKELTKIHERYFFGKAAEAAGQVAAEIEREGTLGEWCFAVEFPPNEASTGDGSEWVKALQCLLDARVAASEAAKRVSHVFGVAKNQVYDRALELSGKK